MAPRKSKRASTSAAKPGKKDEVGSLTAEFITKLATVLQSKGKRTWKAKEVTKALEHAVAALPETELKGALEAGLPAAAAALLEQLQPAEAPAAREPRAKRAKTAKKAEPKKPAAAAPPTLLDADLEAAVQAILGGKAPKALTAAGALVSRFPPAEGLVEFLARQAAGEGAAGALAAADKALQICDALAGAAASPEEALAAFKPAQSLLLGAARALEEGGDLPAWQRLGDLASRALTCMHLAAKEAAAAAAAPDGGAADAARRWLSWGEGRRSGADAAAAAREAASTAVSLCTAARMRGGAAPPDAALAALAARDMRLLAPHAAAGQVAAAAEAAAEEVSRTPEDARLFLALYCSAAEVGAPGPEFYFLRAMAARTAAAAARTLGDDPAAARVLAAAAAAAPPPAALDWLRDQPPSGVVTAALEALAGGPQGLSAHLAYEAPERAVRALAAAARAGGALAAETAVAPGEGPAPADDLLFFESREGDEGALGEGWPSDEEEGSDDDGGGGGGLNLEDLPDEGRRPGSDNEELLTEESEEED